MSMEQTWDPERYKRNARFVTELGTPVVDLLDPKAGERILDLGCGDGVLTEKIAAMGCEVVGVDRSEALIKVAREHGLAAHVMDGQALPFQDEFDAVFSNAALHWMKRADDVVDGVWRALKPGGRFVGEFGGSGNVARIERALGLALEGRGIQAKDVNPWYFPGVAAYSTVLEDRGFQVRYMELLPRPTPLPGGITGWLETFAEGFINAVNPRDRTAFIEEVREQLRPTLCNAEGVWTAHYIRLRFVTQKPV